MAMRREVADALGAEKTPPADGKHVTINHDKGEGDYGYKFSIMTVPRWADKRLRNVSGAAVAVYFCLADHANFDETADALAFPSYETIAREAGVQIGRIAYCINELIAQVLIKRNRRRRCGTIYEVIRSEAHASDEEVLRPAPIFAANKLLRRYKKARKARGSKLLDKARGARFVTAIEKARPARFEKARPARFVVPDTLSSLNSQEKLPPNHQHQAIPLTEVRASTEVKNPPTADDDDSEKTCARKVEILLRARDSTGRGMKSGVALDIARSDDGRATPIAGYEKLLTLIPSKYTLAAGAWWRRALPRWETYGPDEAGQRIEEHQAKASTRPRIDEGELQRRAMKFIATLDDATLKQKWDEALKRSHFSKSMLDNLRLYSLDMMRRTYSAGAGAVFEHCGPGAIDADGGEEA